MINEIVDILIKSKKRIIPFTGLEQSRIILKNVDILRGPQMNQAYSFRHFQMFHSGSTVVFTSLTIRLVKKKKTEQVVGDVFKTVDPSGPSCEKDCKSLL